MIYGQRTEDCEPIVHMLTWTNNHYIGVKKNIILYQRIPVLPEQLEHFYGEHFD